MAGEESVGRVSVEVVPDADNFGKEAEAELKRQRIDPKNVRLVPVIDAKMPELQAQVTAIAKSLDRTSTIDVQTDFSGVSGIEEALRFVESSVIKLPVKWDPDSEAGLRQMLANIEQTFSHKWVLDVDAGNAEEIAQSIRERLADIEREKVRIAAEVVLDKERLAAAQAEMSNALRANVQFDFDDGALAEERARVAAEVADWKASVAVDIDVPIFEQRLAELKARVQKFGKDLVIGLALSLDEGHAKVVEGAIKLITRARDVAVKPEVEAVSRAAASASLALLTRARTVSISVSKKLGNIGSVLSGFDALNKSVEGSRELLTGLFTNLPQLAGATQGIFLLAGSLASSAANMAGLAGSAAQALPVLLAFGGVAVGLGITAAAMKDFSKVLPGVTAQFKGLQDVISKAFWDPGTGAAAGIQSAANALIGPLTTGLKAAGGAIGGFIGDLAGQLGKAVGGDGGQLDSWFGRLTASVQAFQPFIQNVVDIFVQFGDAGSRMLGPLALLVGDLAQRFDLWFQRLTGGAEGMQAFADKSVAALGAIIETVIQFGAIFGAVFRAAMDTGSTTFSELSTSLSGWAEGGGLDRLQQRLTTVFGAAHDMFANFAANAGDGLGGALDNVVKLLSAVLPIVGATTGTLTKMLASIITPEAMGGIQAFVEGIGKGIEALTPAFAPLSGLIAAIGPVLGTLAENLGGAFGALAPTLSGVFTALGPIVDLLGKGLIDVVKAVSPAIQALHDVLASALENPALQDAIKSIIAAIVALIPALTPVISLVSKLIPVLLPIVAAILQPIAGLITQLLPVLNPIVDVIMGIVSAVAPLIPMLLNLVTAILEPLMPLITTLAQAILPLLIPVIQIIATVLQLVIGLVTPLLEVLLPPLIGILTIVIDVIGAVATAITTVLQGALQWIQDGITKVSEGISAFFQKWQEIWNNVLTFFQGLWNGLLNWIKDLLGIHSPSDWFLDLATNMLLGMLNGLKAGWDWIVGFFTAAWQWLKDTFTAAFEGYKAIVLAAWDAISGFFTTAVENVKAIVTGLWDKVSGFFGTGIENVKTLVSNGWEAVKTFFTSGVGNAVTTVTSLPGKLLSGLGNLGSVLYQKGVDLVQGLLNGIGNMAAQIGNWFLDKIPGWIVWPFKQALGIHSPSTVFAGFGENIIHGLIDGMESQHHKVFRSMDVLAAGMADTQFNLPNVTGGGLSAVAQMIAASFAGQASRTLIYNAAPGNSLTSEEDLFAAAGRGRMVW